MAVENRIAAVLARATYDPWAVATAPAALDRPGPRARVGDALRPRTFVEIFLGFYSARSARLALLVSSLILAYGGGAVMFWFHAIYLGEGGPAISNWSHWLLDSTAGFVGLTPAIAVILPLSAWLTAGPAAELRPLWSGVLGGAMFALVTAPGPVMHDALVGRGTWIADKVTAAWGNGKVPAGTPRDAPVAVDMGLQVLAGLPTYVALMLIALLAVRALTKFTAWVRAK